MEYVPIGILVNAKVGLAAEMRLTSISLSCVFKYAFVTGVPSGASMVPVIDPSREQAQSRVMSKGRNRIVEGTSEL